jgi:hypothetical protein
MTIQDLLNWMRAKLRAWLGVKDVDLKDLYDALMDKDGQLVRSEHLRDRLDELAEAYAKDPRRIEIAKEKAEKLNVVPGFTPRSARISRWEADRKATPKK